jgi:hypothetical protein
MLVANRPGEDPVTNPHLALSLGSMNQLSSPIAVVQGAVP